MVGRTDRCLSILAIYAHPLEKDNSTHTKYGKLLILIVLL